MGLEVIRGIASYLCKKRHGTLAPGQPSRLADFRPLGKAKGERVIRKFGNSGASGAFPEWKVRNDMALPVKAMILGAACMLGVTATVAHATAPASAPTPSVS